MPREIRADQFVRADQALASLHGNTPAGAARKAFVRPEAAPGRTRRRGWQQPACGSQFLTIKNHTREEKIHSRINAHEEGGLCKECQRYSGYDDCINEWVD